MHVFFLLLSISSGADKDASFEVTTVFLKKNSKYFLSSSLPPFPYYTRLASFDGDTAGNVPQIVMSNATAVIETLDNLNAMLSFESLFPEVFFRTFHNILFNFSESSKSNSSGVPDGDGLWGYDSLLTSSERRSKYDFDIFFNDSLATKRSDTIGKVKTSFLNLGVDVYMV
jgi:hypothetical protein